MSPQKPSATQSSVGDRLKAKGAKVEPKRGPLWDGPQANTPNGGITFSMLSRFLTCRERFRAAYIDGWKANDHFNHKIEYGQMWHACEEALAKHGEVKNPTDPLAPQPWNGPLSEYCYELREKYKLDRDAITHWEHVCSTQFPLYVEHWKRHPDVRNRTPLLQEQVFDVPYTLPSGRVVRLRGKWDSVDLIREKGKDGIYIQENKTKGDIDLVALQRQLTFDLQTMLYQVAVIEHQKAGNLCKINDVLATNLTPIPIRGTRYNVVRRPLSGGKGSIVRHKATANKPAETHEHYYGRVADVIKEDPGHFFSRLTVDVSPADVKVFRETCLDPILEAVCNWYSVTTRQPITQDLQDCLVNYGHHWRHPFGVTNTIDEYGATDLDEYLNTGSTIGLTRREKLFEELQ